MELHKGTRASGAPLTETAAPGTASIVDISFRCGSKLKNGEPLLVATRRRVLPIEGSSELE
jgi:hypothetical protein